MMYGQYGSAGLMANPSWNRPQQMTPTPSLTAPMMQQPMAGQLGASMPMSSGSNMASMLAQMLKKMPTDSSSPQVDT